MSQIDDPCPESASPEDRALVRTVVAAGSVIVRAPTEEELFQRVCDVLVGNGSFVVAWIGLTEPAGNRLTEMAAAGRDPETVERIRLLAGSAEDRAALLRLIRAKRTRVIEVPGAGPPGTGSSGRVRELARESGIGSVAYLPLVARRVPHGILILGAEAAGYFDARRLRMLEVLAEDIAVKVDWIGRRIEPRATSEALLAATARLRAFFHEAPYAILLVSPTIIEMNPEFASMFGLDAGANLSLEELGRLFLPEAWHEMMAFRHRRFAGKSAPARYETVGLRDGSVFPILVQVRPVQLESEKAFACFITDLTPGRP